MGELKIRTSQDLLKGLNERKGTYILIFELKSDYRLMVGRLGVFTFPAGWYCYSGSALGPGGLAGRLRHHLKIADRAHWHMDFLRPLGCIREIWYGRAPFYDEHRWAENLRTMAGTLAIAPGFGSSDCGCETHLVRFDAYPSIARFRRRQPVGSGIRRPPVYRMAVDDILSYGKGRKNTKTVRK